MTPSVSTGELKLRNVEAKYGRLTVLRDVSVTVNDGSVTALIGPNGAGKTTLLKLISGLLRPSKGEIFLDDRDITSLSAYRRARNGICHVVEGRGIYRSLSVKENILLQSPKGEFEFALERVTSVFPLLGRRLKQVAGTLSGGEQQMLALGSAYVRHPTLVLVDEPSLGLAPTVVDTVFEFLTRLREERVSLLVVDQFVDRVLSIADHVYLLRQGEISYDGPPEGMVGLDAFEHYVGDAAS